MKSLILDTLRKLDVDNDKHWTETGTPLLEAVRNIAGDDSLSKQEIAAVAPDFRRDKPELPLIDADPATLMDTPESELTDNERTALTAFVTSQIVEHQNLHAATMEKRKELDQDLVKHDGTIARLNAKLNVLNPPKTKQEKIQEYLERQKKDRVEEFERNQAIQKLTSNSLSDLDRSFRRENRRAHFAGAA